MPSTKEIIKDESIIILFKVLSFIAFLSIFLGAMTIASLIFNPVVSLTAVTVATYLFSKIFKEDEVEIPNDQI